MFFQKKVVIVIIVFSLLISTTLITIFLFSTQLDSIIEVASSPTSTPIILPSPTPSPTPDPLRARTFLLLGYMGGNHEGSLLTDTLILSNLNFKTKELTLISIPRDLWVAIPSNTHPATASAGKINQLYALGSDKKRQLNLPNQYQHAKGGLLLAKDVVGDIMGQNIDYVLSINQNNLIAVLNRLGPIPIQVPYSFTDDYFPIAGEETNTCGKSPVEIASLSAVLRGFELEKQFGCRYEKLIFNAGNQDFDASTAAKFVRSRHSNVGGSDFGRSQRQQALIKGIKTLISQPTTWVKLPTIAGQLYQQIETNITLPEILSLATLVTDPSHWQITSYQINESNALWETRSPDGQYILIDRAASGSAQLNSDSWPTIREIVKSWLTQVPAEATFRGDSFDDQAP